MPASDPTDLTHLLAIVELADCLGVNVRHIRRLVHERRIPFIKWGHLIRFDPHEIAGWIDANRRALGGAEPIAAARSSAPVLSLPRRRSAQTEPPVRGEPKVADPQLRLPGVS